MKEIATYLTFDGTCAEAMKFYADCLGAELNLTSFADAKLEVPKEALNRTIHARLTKGAMALMASDTMPGQPHTAGNNFSVCVQCESQDEIERLFAALGKNGKVGMPLQDTFWGAHFGTLTDQFGINWMFNFPKTPMPGA